MNINYNGGGRYIVQGIDITDYYRPFENCIISSFEKNGDKITKSRAGDIND